MKLGTDQPRVRQVDDHPNPAAKIVDLFLAGVTVYELARIMGTSVRMIELHYGALLDTANESLLDRLETFGALEGHGQEAGDGSNPHGS
jgi:hypothetical protein